MRTGSEMPPWVAVVVGVVLVVGVGWRLLRPEWLSGSTLPRSTDERVLEEMRQQGLDYPARPDPTPTRPRPPALRVDIAPLAAMPPARFVFDERTRGRVVTCGTESLDGGRTWAPLGADPTRRSIALGGVRAATPVAGRDRRVLCGDAILPAGRGAATGVGDIQSAVEWDGTMWRPAGLPLAAAAASSDPRLALAVGYAPDGTARVARPDRLLAPGQTTELPGTAEAWAMDASGVAYASIATTSRRARLMQLADEAWSEVPAPGEVRALAVDGEQVWVAAGMLGRGTRGRWAWTRWPREARIDGPTGRGATVVAWGPAAPGSARGALVVSRDGGATVQPVLLDRIRPVWAAIDPFAPSELLLLDDEGTLSRVRLL